MIPFYSFKEIHNPVEEELIAKSAEIIRSGNYVFGTEKFEEEFADYVGTKYCVAVSSGTSALHLALLSLGIGSGDEVITVSHTFRATVSAIKYCGATPVFVDIDPKTFTLNPDQIEKKITNKTKLIMPVHIYGNFADMNSILAISNKFNIPVVEDCSQAHGTKYFGQHVGSFGNIGTFSFYPGKGLGALGDAGCITTNDKEIANYIKKARTWDDNEVGFNYRMANIQAEFLRVKLKYFDRILEQKREIANQYSKHFNYVQVNDGVEHSFHIYPILIENRDEIIKNLKSKVDLKTHYPIPVHRLLAYKDSYYLPITDHIAFNELSLPIYPGVDYNGVVEAINDYSSSLL